MKGWEYGLPGGKKSRYSGIGCQAKENTRQTVPASNSQHEQELEHSYKIFPSRVTVQSFTFRSDLLLF